MKKTICIIVLFFLLSDISWSNPALILKTENLPPEFTATYDVRKGHMRVGKMNVSLKKIGDELIYESTTKPVGIAALFLGNQEITDYAVLKFIDESYKTVEFRHETKGSDKNRNEYYVFDWDHNKAKVQYKDRRDILDISPYTFDYFSAQLLLMREPNTEDIEKKYSVISKGRLKDYTYKLVPNESIETKLGKVTASKYVRTKDDEKKTTLLGWYAESLNYIPVKLENIENGKIDISIQITEVNWL